MGMILGKTTCKNQGVEGNKKVQYNLKIKNKQFCN